MSVELQPAELGFKRPFTHEVTQVLRLHNPHTESVAFKVKTTAPKQYCVRPNSGRIEPSSTVEVQVLLQSMKEDPPLDAKCRDKFLVQSVIVPSSAAPDANVTQIWSNVEATNKGAIQEKKIRVTFLPAEGQANGIGAAGVHDEEPVSSHTMAASPVASTPQRSAPTATEPASPSLIDQSVASVQSAAETVGNTASSTFSTVAAAVPTSTEELKQQLADAQATISKLQAQATEGLRQRKVTDSTTETKAPGSSTSMQQQSVPGGVPVQIVAALCLLSFILAYFFF